MRDEAPMSGLYGFTSARSFTSWEETVDQWYGPEATFYKVRTEDRSICVPMRKWEGAEAEANTAGSSGSVAILWGSRPRVELPVSVHCVSSRRGV